MSSKALVVGVVVLAVVAWMGLATGAVVGPAGAAGAGRTIEDAPASSFGTGASAAPAPLGTLEAHPPSVDASLTSVSAALSVLPAALKSAPWIQSLARTGPTLRPLASVPNLNLLEHPAKPVDGKVPLVELGYDAQPAPLGLADYGLGATPYSYNTSHILGQVTFNAPPNVSDPGSEPVIVPSATHLGDVGSVYEFGIQLNTIATNISFPGADDGFFWTQNVVNWNATAIHFVSDTFNFSSPAGYIPPGTILSGCNNNTSGVDQILAVYGGVFQCVGPNIPISAASYPITLQLYNNATVNAQNYVQVSYGYRLDEAGIGQNLTGVTDTLVFNSSTPGVAPPNTPGFSIDGFNVTPLGLLRDAEIDIVGDIEGDNAAFRSASGSLNLEYSNLSSGGFQSVPSAYNFGGDTGETSFGLADYWVANHTLEFNQGPSMLYGLWNATPSGSVAAGAIQISGSIIPSYGFVFISNTAPVADPWLNNSSPDNMSWVPTTNAGTFDTYLPPLGAPWATQYYVQAFAAGSSESNGTPITGNTSGYALTLSPAPGTLNAPLYMFGNAQAASLAANVSGSVGPPYAFDDLNVSVNASFNHLNDWLYGSFEVFMAQGVTVPISVSNVSQGPDAPNGTFYIEDGAPSPPGQTGFLFPAPAVTPSIPNYTAQINIYGGTDDQVANETLVGYYIGLVPQGGAIVLWGDQDASVSNVWAEFASNGVWFGDSNGTMLENITGIDGAAAIEDIQSTNTTAANVTALAALGIEAYNSTNDSYSNVTVEYGGIGIEVGYDIGLTAGFGYYDVPGVQGLTLRNWTVLGTQSIGALVDFSNNTTVAGFVVDGAGAGLALVETNNSTVTDFASNETLDPVYLGDANSTTMAHLALYNSEYGVEVLGDSVGGNITGSVFLGIYEPAVVIFGSGFVVYNNSFVGNENSTLVYNPSAIQAYTVPGNAFNSPGDVGNFWADWHSTTDGRLNPYVISNGVSDNFPLSVGPGLYTVTFSETGLPSTGRQWSVIADGIPSGTSGTSTSPTVTSISFPLPNGTFGYSAASAQYSNSEGTFTVNGANVTEPVAFTLETFGVTFTESGLTTKGSEKKLATDGWSVVLNGVRHSSRSSTISFTGLANGTYPVLVTGPSGIQASGSGTVTVNGATAVGVVLSVGKTVTLTFSEKGLPKGQEWTVALDGAPVSSATGSAKFVNLSEGTYSYSVLSPLAGQNITQKVGTSVTYGANGTVDLTGGRTVHLTFAYRYTVELTESGLPSGGTWSVTIKGVTLSNSTGSPIFFSLVNGTYRYSVHAVTGYKTSPSSGRVTVAGKAVTVPTITFTAKGHKGTSAPYDLGMSTPTPSNPATNTYWEVIPLSPTAGLTTGMFGLSISSMGGLEQGTAGDAPSTCTAGATLSASSCGAPTTSGHWYVVLASVATGAVLSVYTGTWSQTVSVTSATELVLVSYTTYAGMGDTLNAISTSSESVSGSVSL
jgi:thermopsin